KKIIIKCANKPKSPKKPNAFSPLNDAAVSIVFSINESLIPGSTCLNEALKSFFIQNHLTLHFYYHSIINWKRTSIIRTISLKEIKRRQTMMIEKMIVYIILLSDELVY